MDLAPAAGSAEERARFEALQATLPALFRRVFPDPHAAQTIVVLPGLTLDAAEVAKLSGAPHYEERLLCLLMLLRRPRTRVVYVTSQPLDERIVDYYLHLLPGVPAGHARRRLTLLDCHDASPRTLTEKILARPRLVERIREALGDPASAHLTCFNVTPLERTLAVRLGIPIYGTDPERTWIGTKSGSREMFRRAAVPLADGEENLRTRADVVRALAGLRRRNPGLARAVVKLNDGFSGEGNALFTFAGAPGGDALEGWIDAELPRRLTFDAPAERLAPYLEKMERMGGTVECWIEGEGARSPSVQCRVDPSGEIEIVSTHDQVLGGPNGGVFEGCTFPADPAYCADIQATAIRVAAVLRDHGVLGRFGVDFVCRPRPGGGWEHAALEVNLRKGGTTHPYLMLQFLTDGAYDPRTGTYLTRAGRPRYYRASDNLHDPAFLGLTADDLFDVAVENGIYWDAAAQEGVMFHLIGALSEFGKVGMVCIAGSPEGASRLYDETLRVLRHAENDVEPRANGAARPPFAPALLDLLHEGEPGAAAA